ncbi:beta-glucuronidase [Bacteroidia bacterium]|nr:beta-glucuronidase [Bacteroidia bacterium]
MNYRLSFSIFIISLLLFACTENPKRDFIDLQGVWRFELDASDQGETGKWYEKTLGDQIILPGTTDTNEKGELNTQTDETTHLSRVYSYKGKAWYQKEIKIPHRWKNRTMSLILERTKPAKVWVDDQYAGSSKKISTQQEYDLSGLLTPGKHVLTILVDNGLSVPRQLLSNSHAYAESTQTNWNGIIGDMRIEARSLFHIQTIQVYPDVATKSATVKIKFNRPDGITGTSTLSLLAEACNTFKKHRVTVKKKIDVSSDEEVIVLQMGENALLWDEFAPAFYKLTITLKGKNSSDTHSINFGLRDFKAEGTQFVINGNTTFLRGKHDACVFPLTGHVAMDTASWRRYFRIAKSYGVNHYRFHSWCPPAACFEAANIEGIYLQPELPYWGEFNERDTTLINFLTREGVDIQNAYGNQPSFVMFALGNELSGNQAIMMKMVEMFRKIDDRHLYASGSNNYLGFNKYAPGDDYFTTCRVGAEVPSVYNTHTRGSFSFADAIDGGIINHTYPNSVMNFDSAVYLCPIPVISHETGQFQIYPDYREIEKYTGVLKPRNFEVFRKRLEDAGMAKQAHDFFLASGKWSALLYKTDIEMDLRTKGFGGFQLLDLQDYPGQGSAYVGILDAFMDSKGLISPEEWREFCSEIVPMFATEKFCYTNDESLSGDILIANYSKNVFEKQQIIWELRDENSKTVDKGSVDLTVKQGVLKNLGNIQPNISSIQKAQKVTLTLLIPDTKYKNTCSLWIYPQQQIPKPPPSIEVTGKLDKRIGDILRKGGKVLYFPNHKQVENVTVGGLFQTDYWNYRMFKSICENINKPVSPGTLGLLTDPKHPLFNDFSTDFHTNWQWFSIIKHSRPLILDQAPQDYLPIVQVIDNVERNHKLGLIFEWEVNGGKLLVCMSDLFVIQDKPEARQLYGSILSYMTSDAFAPSCKIDIDELSSLFQMATKEEKIAVLNNISY